MNLEHRAQFMSITDPVSLKGGWRGRIFEGLIENVAIFAPSEGNL